ARLGKHMATEERARHSGYRAMSGPTRSHRVKTMLRHVLPPLIVFAVARAFLLMVASSAGFDGWDARNWAHWDSEHYLSIARRGYIMYRSPIRPDEWDGNVGWPPGFPYMIRLLCLTGL